MRTKLKQNKPNTTMEKKKFWWDKITDAVNKVSQVTEALTKELQTAATSASQGSRQASTSQPQATTQTQGMSSAADTSRSYSTDVEAKAYFKGILASDFAQYEIREDVPVSALGGSSVSDFNLYTDNLRQYSTTEGRAFDFGLYQSGALKAVISLGGPGSHNRKKKYLVSRMFALKAGVAYINFYTHLPNDRDYIVNRIHKLLP